MNLTKTFRFSRFEKGCDDHDVINRKTGELECWVSWSWFRGCWTLEDAAMTPIQGITGRTKIDAVRNLLGARARLAKGLDPLPSRRR